MKRALVTLLLCCCCATVSTDARPLEPRNEALESLMSSLQSAGECPADGHLMLDTVITAMSSAVLIEQIHACKGKRIVIEVDSPGGSVYAAWQIQKAIERHDQPVACVVDGFAASAAFVTLQSCTTRYATDRAVLMAHAASSGAEGQAEDLQNGAEVLRVINWGMIERCSKRMGMSHAEFESRVSGGLEWWFSQADALKFHAIDAPADSVAAVVLLAKEG